MSNPRAISINALTILWVRLKKGPNASGITLQTLVAAGQTNSKAKEKHKRKKNTNTLFAVSKERQRLRLPFLEERIQAQ